MNIHEVNNALELGYDDIPCINYKLPKPDLIVEYDLGCYWEVIEEDGKLVTCSKIEKEKEEILESIGNEVWIGKLDEFLAIWKENPIK